MIPTEQHSALAVRDEAAHFPDRAATRDVVPETTGKSLSVPLTQFESVLSFQTLSQQPMTLLQQL